MFSRRPRKALSKALTRRNLGYYIAKGCFGQGASPFKQECRRRPHVNSGVFRVRLGAGFPPVSANPARYHGNMRWIKLALTLALGCAMLPAAQEKGKTAERLDDAATLFTEIMGAPDKSIPQDLLDKSHCIVLVPGLKKGAFVFGGKYGRGFAVCREPHGQGWGPPAAIRIEGGSFGIQIGFSSSDVVLLVMNERGMQKLTTSKFTIGADATAAIGPVGRNATAQTDALMHAEILSWSRSRGAFAGASLDGATLRNDIDDNQTMYGQRWTSKQILGSGAKTPASAQKLITQLNKYSPRKTS
jgi:SH3 domain-containing YSC84-like protein 1